jgi:putative membrane protein
MTVRWILATLHLLALGIGLGAIVTRARALARTPEPAGWPRIFLADNLWALAAFLWIATGLARAFAGYEKGSAYYLSNPLFHGKLGLVIAIVLLEIWPMVTLIKCRIALRKGTATRIDNGPALAGISWVQAVLVVVIVFLGTAIARGFFI